RVVLAQAADRPAPRAVGGAGGERRARSRKARLPALAVRVFFAPAHRIGGHAAPFTGAGGSQPLPRRARRAARAVLPAAVGAGGRPALPRELGGLGGGGALL